MEYASGGELFNKISSIGRIAENEAKVVFAQVISAVQYMVRDKNDSTFKKCTELITKHSCSLKQWDGCFALY